MLSQSTIDKLKKYIDVDKLIEAVKSETEVEVEMPELSVFTTEELTMRDAAKVAEGKKEGLDTGKEAGREIAVKELKKQFGVEIEGKDLGKLVEAVKGQLAKGDDGLKEQIKLLQQKNTEYETQIQNIQQEAEAAKFDASLLAELPANRSDLISDNEYLMVIKANLQFDQEGVKKNGELVRDPKTMNPIPRKDAINQFFTERKWVKQEQQVPGGRGSGNNVPPTRPSSLPEAEKAWEAQGKGTGTAEFQQYINGLMKDNPDFVLRVETEA